MNPKISDESLAELTGALRLAVEGIRREPIPEKAMQQALSRACSKAVAPVRDGRKRRRALLAYAAALIGLVSILPWLGSPSCSWAEVVQAVHATPWMHSTCKGPGGQKDESWLSPAQGISASRWDKRVEFRDHKLRIYWSFDPDENVLYRLPELRDQTRTHYLQLMDTFAGLLRADPKAESARAYLQLAGNADAPLQAINEKPKSVKDEAGRNWLAYEFNVRSPEGTEPFHISVLVDPRTKLPHLWKVEGTIGKEKLSREIVFDYPEKGPVDAYALGVPRSAKVVDRIPKDDLARLIAGVQAGRQRFDAYCAIVVTSNDKEEWWSGRPSKIWRKGDRWRMDFLGSIPGKGKVPPAGANRTQWWHDRASELRSFPSMVCDGETTYWMTMKAKEAADPRNTTFDVVSTQKTSRVGPEDDPIPAAYSSMPEFLSHPPMGIGGQDLEPALELQPRDGPPGTVLLKVKRVGNRLNAQLPKDLPPAPDMYRFWIDPLKSYVAMRWQMGEGDGEDVNIVEELAQSPGGHWYPTVVRRKNAGRGPDGKPFDDVLYRFYLDFNAPLPDTLFQPPK